MIYQQKFDDLPQSLFFTVSGKALFSIKASNKINENNYQCTNSHLSSIPLNLSITNTTVPPSNNTMLLPFSSGSFGSKQNSLLLQMDLGNTHNF